jgi:putative phosphoribosyl transferase
MFETRRDAGHLLAARLASRLAVWCVADPIVIGLARGGAVVAAETARLLGVPLDLVVVQGLHSPGHPGRGIGTLVMGSHPEVALDEPAIMALGLSRAAVSEEVERQMRVGRLREALLRGGERSSPLRGRSVILVDDGVATGGTMAAAVRAVRRAEPRHVLVATPVASPEAVRRLDPLVDGVVCLQVPRSFSAVGAYYGDFRDVSDGEAIALLAAGRRRSTHAAVDAR